MKKLKKFQKFALSPKQASKVKGGVQRFCGSGEDMYIISASTWEELDAFYISEGC